MKSMKARLFLGACVLVLNCYNSLGKESGVDIGNTCNNDTDCIEGNGGPYSKCHQPSSTCICTVNIVGDYKCNYTERNHRCVATTLSAIFDQKKMSALECTPEDEGFIFKGYPMWFRTDVEPFSSQPHINDKKTSACFDPDRAYKTTPDGIRIKTSSIPNAGLGVFTDVYIERGTIFGPCKGYYFYGDYNPKSPYIWQFPKDTYPGNADSWIDGTHVFVSNYLRFINMAPTVARINIITIAHKEMYYYYAIKTIQPGTELLATYGPESGKKLGITYEHTPYVSHAPFGFAGGNCDKECMHDVNAVCIAGYCLCKPGTHYRYGSCITDEAICGRCSGDDGDECQKTRNAVCQRGLCVCRAGTTVFMNKCIPDEGCGGRCSSPNGHDCLLDSNADCVNGLCMCKFGTSEVEGKCMKIERPGGRCMYRADGEACLHEKTAVCVKDMCKCASGMSDVEGKCIKDGALGGFCVDGICEGENVICEIKSKKCVCKRGYIPDDDDKCVEQ